MVGTQRTRAREPVDTCAGTGGHDFVSGRAGRTPSHGGPWVSAILSFVPASPATINSVASMKGAVPMISRRLTRSIAVVAAVIVVGGGAYGIVNATSSSGPGAGTAATPTPGQVILFIQGQPSPTQVVGQIPPSYVSGRRHDRYGNSGGHRNGGCGCRVSRRHRRPCCATEQRRLRSPHHRCQLAAPCVRQQQLHRHRRRVGCRRARPLAQGAEPSSPASPVGVVVLPDQNADRPLGPGGG